MEQILGVKFFDGSVSEAVETMIRRGGLLVVPAAPALVNIQYDEAYRDALVQADLAIADSGFMVLLWKTLRGKQIQRISGLAYLKRLLESLRIREPAGVYFIVPTEAAKVRAMDWLGCRGVLAQSENYYVAPRYGPLLVDEELVGKLNTNRPPHVVIGVGGGVQEKLGRYLRDALQYRPAIHCIGAALGFLTGDQKPIPDWADRFYLGWLLRLARDPRLYLRRFWVAHELPGLIARYGERLPPLKPPDVRHKKSEG
jgi:UDP-N-acetyl-D-mannosaminuronic acid transferase (WecB/TagA/CpsF family)